MSTCQLCDLPAGTQIRLLEFEGGRQFMRKLLSLGLSIGGEFEILHDRSCGVVLARGGNRIAIGRGMAAKIRVEAL